MQTILILFSVIDNSEEWTEERRWERAEQQRRRRERSEREEKQKLARLLPIADRDEQYRRIVMKILCKVCYLNQKYINKIKNYLNS